jgi:hypothetical protein
MVSDSPRHDALDALARDPAVREADPDTRRWLLALVRSEYATEQQDAPLRPTDRPQPAT